jgi:hypothetical protein
MTVDCVLSAEGVVRHTGLDRILVAPGECRVKTRCCLSRLISLPARTTQLWQDRFAF